MAPKQCQWIAMIVRWSTFCRLSLMLFALAVTRCIHLASPGQHQGGSLRQLASHSDTTTSQEVKNQGRHLLKSSHDYGDLEAHEFGIETAGEHFSPSELWQREIRFGSIIGGGVLLLLALSFCAVLKKSQRIVIMICGRRCRLLDRKPRGSVYNTDKEASLRMYVRLPEDERASVEGGGVSESARILPVDSSKDALKTAYTAMAHKETKARTETIAVIKRWRCMRTTAFLVLFFANAVTCLGLPYLYSNKINRVSCTQGFRWEMHMVFFSCFMMAKFVELFFYTFDPTIEGELDFGEFTMVFLLSFLGYSDPYLDSTSIHVTAACGSQNEIAYILSWTMYISFAMGVVFFQWIVLFLFIIQDPSQATLAKLVHMDALAKCMEVPPEHLTTWESLCQVRTYGEDMPQAIQQSIYVCKVSRNAFMIMSICSSVICGVKSLLDLVKQHVEASYAHKRFMRWFGVSAQESHKVLQEAIAEAEESPEFLTKDYMAMGAGASLKELQDNYPYLRRPDHELYDLIKDCQQSLENAAKKEKREEIQGVSDLGSWEQDAQDIIVRIRRAVELEEATLKAGFEQFTSTDCLTVEQLKLMLDWLGFPASDDDVDWLLEVIDQNHDRTISFPEFHAFVGMMGGIFKLFGHRRAQVVKDHKDGAYQSSEIDKQRLRAELLETGISDEDRYSWGLYLQESEFTAVMSLDPFQKKAIWSIRQLAKRNHEEMMPALEERCSTFVPKITKEELWKTLKFVQQEAPVIVHVDLGKLMDVFENDTHYRNQFETGTSGGLLKLPVRRRWEKTLFAGAYDAQGAQDKDRPKYGVLNVMRDGCGVQRCRQYGSSYLVLKDVRLRSTCSPQDSANLKGDQLAVLDYYAHVLYEYSDAELREIVDVANLPMKFGDSWKAVSHMKYKEAQIHGEICFKQHVEKLVAHTDHKSDEARLKKLCTKHDWQLSWVDEEQNNLIGRTSAMSSAAFQSRIWSEGNTFAVSR